jgi:hypothetical protein
MNRIAIAGGFAAFALVAGTAWAKLPPPPPLDDKAKAAAEEKKEKDAVAAEKAKAAHAAAVDAAIKNYQSNMRKAGKPIPKPVPVAAASPPPKAGEAKPSAAQDKAAPKK